MSFRLFVYYCAVGGAWCGFVGWLIGRALVPGPSANAPESIVQRFFDNVFPDCIAGLVLGLTVAFGLSLLDSIFSFSLRQFGKVLSRVFAAVIIGTISGLLGTCIGSSIFFGIKEMIGRGFVANVSYVVGWTIVGALMGFSISIFEVLRSVMTKQDFAGSMRKVRNCLIGGTVGGVLGGFIAFTLSSLAEFLIQRQNLRSPVAIGFVAIGACIGLLVGLAQIILKEAWIKVEAGFRPGREMLISKEKTTIGRAEGSDIALFGDSSVEKTHASIVLDAGRYYLEDFQSPSGSFVNDKKVEGRTALKAGDLIRVGKSVLRFHERAKRKE